VRDKPPPSINQNRQIFVVSPDCHHDFVFDCGEIFVVKGYNFEILKKFHGRVIHFVQNAGSDNGDGR